MRRKILIISLGFFMFPGLALGEEYAFSPVHEGSRSTEDYFSRLGIPNVMLTERCSDNGKKCWPVIKNQNGDILKQFGSKDSVSVIASGRYRGFASALIKYRRECSGKSCPEPKVFLINDKGQKTNFSFSGYNEDKVLFKIISINNHLILLTSSSIVTVMSNGETRANPLSEQIELTTGVLRNNPDGEISVIAVSTNDEIVLGNLNQQSIVPYFALSRRGDRKDILGVYLTPENVIHGIVYKYVNEYCKGLFYVGLSGEDQFRKGWIFNSEDRNIGWEPDIHYENGNVIISSINSSSHNQKVYFSISEADLGNIEYAKPGHLSESLCQEKWGSFLVGGGISKVSWIANSQVKKNDITVLDVDYDISDSLFWTAQFEGRIGDTQLTLAYLKHKAEKVVEEIGDESASDVYNYFAADFYGLLSKSASLRLVLEKSRINGIATVKKYDTLTSPEELPFQSKYDRYAALITREKGLYYGAQYEKYTMPSAIGFSNQSKSIVFADFDPEFGIQKASLLIGYDILAYSKRYETNYNNWYFAGNIGLGLVWLDISEEIENRAKASTGGLEIDTPMAFAVDGMAELGYIWQQRFKTFKGFGYAVNLGYRAKGVYMGAGQAEDSEASTDGLALEFNRYDVLHGPFAQFNLIF